MSSPLKETFAALAVRPFRILCTGTLFACTGFFMSTVAQSVVAFQLTGENSAVGLVVFAQGLTMFSLGPIGGAFADRWPKRRVVATGQLLTAAIFGSIAWAIWADRISLSWLVIGSLIMGASFAFVGPARQSLSIELVPETLRGNAVALTQVGNTACRVLGPAVAGALLTLPETGLWLSYAVMGFLYLISVVSLRLLPPSVVREGAQDKKVLQDVVDGIRYVGSHPYLRALLLLYTLVVIVGFPHVTVLPGFVENVFNRPAETSSVLFAVSALGGLAAGIWVARLADSPGSHRLFLGLGFAFAGSLLLTAASPNFLTAVGLLVMIGLTSGGFQTLASSVIVRSTEPRYVGRVMSLTMLSFAGFGLMGLPIGYLADALGERASLAIEAVVVAVVVLAFRGPIRRGAERRVREGELPV